MRARNSTVGGGRYVARHSRGNGNVKAHVPRGFEFVKRPSRDPPLQMSLAAGTGWNAVCVVFALSTAAPLGPRSESGMTVWGQPRPEPGLRRSRERRWGVMSRDWGLGMTGGWPGRFFAALTP